MSEPMTNQAGPPATVKDASPLTAAVEESIERMQARAEIEARVFGSAFESAAATRHYQKVAKFYAESAFVPESFKNKPGDCLIALDIASRMGEHPLLVMQNMLIVKGRPGWFTRFMIARCNRHAGFKSSITWETTKLGEPITVKAGSESYQIPNIRVTAWALDRFGNRIEESVDTQMAIGEAWTANTKYRSMPERMFRWRSASALINEFAPEVMMGVPVAEDLETDVEAPSGFDFAGLQGVKPAGATASAALRPAEPVQWEQSSPSEPGGHTLTGPHFASLRELSHAAGVSWQEFEGLYAQAVDEMVSREGETESAFYDRLLADLNGLFAKAETKAGGSLFDADEKSKKK